MHSPFNGLIFEDFPEFEHLLKVNFEVYSLTEDGFASSVYTPIVLQETTMYVNLYENHISYIKDLSMCAQKYRCTTCDRHFKQSNDLHRHQRVCSNKTKFVYPSGFHNAQESIFDRLDKYEIRVPEDEHTFEWYICYDFEALQQNVYDQSTEFIHWTAKHVPISVSICRNVDGFNEPMCFVEPDQDQLVQSMVSRMRHIADRVYELA